MQTFKKFFYMALAIVITGQINSLQAQIDIVFVDHLTAGLVEQDLFVEKTLGSDEVFRVLPNERAEYMDAQLFKSASPQKHDPFNAYNAGPYPKGESAGMTLKEWTQGRGTATYACEEGWGRFKAEFTNLVPNSTYTMWHFFMAKESTTPFTGTLDLPMGDRDGKHATFTTDASGNASMDISFDRCLQLGEIQLASAIAVAYHSDGKTYGVLPGDFGTVTHVQLFAILPDADAPAKVEN